MTKANNRLVKSFVLLVALLLTAGTPAIAQDVTVSIAEVTGRPGTSVTVPVTLSGLDSPADDINSFNFTVSGGAGITFTGIETTGSLVGDNGFSASANTSTGVVGGFAQGTPISSNGTLLKLTFSLDSVNNGTISLSSIGFNAGTPSVNASASNNYVVSNRIMSVGSAGVVFGDMFQIPVVIEDALVAGDNVNSFSMTINYDPSIMTVDKSVGTNGVVTDGTIADGLQSVNGNDVGGVNSGQFQVAGFGSTITGSGDFFKVAFVAANSAGSAPVSLSNLSFEAGNPMYGLSAGSVIVSANEVPVADAKSVTVAEDGSVDITLSATDANGDAVTFAIQTQPASGSVTLTGSTATYAPNPDFNGSDSFTYVANDGDGDSLPATVSITVTAVNDLPTVADAAITTDEDVAGSVDLVGTDVDGDALTFSVATAPVNGSVEISGATATYTPASGFSGSDSFTVVANDGTGNSAPATVSVTVNQVNSAPAAQNVAVITNEDTAIAVTLSASDADGDPLTFTIQAAPSNGTVHVTGATATYTPSADFNGTDTFTYVANDGTVDSAPAIVTINVQPVNDAPVVIDASITTTEDVAGSVDLEATDVDGDPLVFSVADGPSNGTVEIVGNTVTYTPDADFNGTDSFTVVANDGTVASAPATVSVTVSAENDAPVAEAATLDIDEDTAGTVTLVASDADGDDLTVSVVDEPSNGTVTLDGTTATYTPNADFYGSDSFTFKANDGNADSNTATVSVNVAPVNDAPEFVDVLADTNIAEDAGFFSFTYTASDVDGDDLAFSFDGDVDSAFSLTSDGTLSFDPNGNPGTFAVIVVVSDGTLSATTSATVVVYNVDAVGGPLSGIHEVPPVPTPAAGNVVVRVVAETATLQVTGSFENLSGSFTAAHIHGASVGENGGVLVPLSPAVSSDGRSGTFDDNIDLTTIDGLDIDAFASLVRAGGTYVNVHSSANSAGEIRGQLLALPNVAPGAAVVLAPSSVVITGDPNDTGLSVNWLPVSDANGDEVNYVFQVATSADFTESALFESLGTINSITFTIDELASIFDQLVGASDLGGSLTLFHRVIATDGSSWTTGPTKELELVRGTVTDTESDSALPTEFALRSNYPNPFTGVTNVSFDLPETSDVRVQVLDMLGREVLSITPRTMQAGSGQTLQIDGTSLSSGVYLYRITATSPTGVDSKVGTMTLLK